MRKFALLTLLLCCVFSGCTLGFVPLVPRPVQLEPQLVLGAASGFVREGNELVLQLEFLQVPTEAFVAARLYRNDKAVAENSALVDASSKRSEFRFEGAVLGRYRVVVFWDGHVVRQFELVVD